MRNPFSKLILIWAVVLCLPCTLMFPAPPDEGMYPLSEILKLDLKSAGLKIPITDIYNPSGTSLVDALVRLGGCTGSFVSGNGLILTNHHCTFDFVRQASTVEKNYLADGFYAASREEEIPAQGLTCMITESYKDVSEEILQAASAASVPAERVTLIQKKIRELTKSEEKSNPGIKAEVSEMFTGKTYILFRYKILKDVRLVFVPPRSVGDFGGENDNWVWPRHTGDFTFVRAYVGPDGKPAEYSKNNIPFIPKRFLKVNPNGVDENDFVFVLGYPGRTFRHFPAKYMEFQEKYQLPYVSKLFESFISLYEELGKNNPELALKYSSRIKTLANTEKNYRGKILGLQRLELVKQKQAEEAELQQFILADQIRTAAYKDLLHDIDEAYMEQCALGRTSFFVSSIRARIYASRLATQLIEYKSEMCKPENDRKSAYSAKNRALLFEGYAEDLKEADCYVDGLLLKRIISEAVTLPELSNFEPLSQFRNKTEEQLTSEINSLLNHSIVFDSAKFMSAVKDSSNLSWQVDPLISFMMKLDTAYKPIEKRYETINGKLNVLLPKYLDVKHDFKQKSFVPDANSTLRLTYGYVRGYTPVDATYYKPITTLAGVMEKGVAGGVYTVSPKLRALYDKKDFGRFRHKKLNDVPVDILYNMDTTGGNSGSPVLNAWGEMIGLNFDRAFEATINDFAWSESYSRSIGADIRYILFVTQKLGGADKLLNELGVE
ncbi:MAG: S46 family peptidase [Ignavibacteria bacterium]|nr:S46 family peptidase [Ignavibacteria bacterium]